MSFISNVSWLSVSGSSVARGVTDVLAAILIVFVLGYACYEDGSLAPCLLLIPVTLLMSLVVSA